MESLPYILFYVCALCAPIKVVYGALYATAPVVEAENTAFAYLILKRNYKQSGSK